MTPLRFGAWVALTPLSPGSTEPTLGGSLKVTQGRLRSRAAAPESGGVQGTRHLGSLHCPAVLASPAGPWERKQGGRQALEDLLLSCQPCCPQACLALASISLVLEMPTGLENQESTQQAGRCCPGQEGPVPWGGSAMASSLTSSFHSSETGAAGHLAVACDGAGGWCFTAWGRETSSVPSCSLHPATPNRTPKVQVMY